MNRKRFRDVVLGAVSLSLLAAAPARAGVVHNRQERQQQRIAQGVASGQLTARETARLENREAHLNREINGMRRFNGGSLTPSERALVNHQQNQLSRSIYRQKHDAETR
ncbi:MAG TPA: hypothetical protein VMH79_13820 [Thermoanaerobaculia bacterium]|nr:hypothetical protein [Thermoanaerobaculia bacterium]